MTGGGAIVGRAYTEVEAVEVAEPHLAVAAAEDEHVVLEDVGRVELPLGGGVLALDLLPLDLDACACVAAVGRSRYYHC